MSEVNQEIDFPQTGTLQMELKTSNSTPEVTSLEITQNAEVWQKLRTCCMSLQLPSNYIYYLLLLVLTTSFLDIIMTRVLECIACEYLLLNDSMQFFIYSTNAHFITG